MEKPIHPAGKVSQIANLFQRKHVENSIAVVRTESHSTRFNNARALFEKLGVESNSNLSIKISRSNSRDDNLCDLNHPDRCSSRSSDHSASPPKKHSPFPPGANVAASVVNNNCTQSNGCVTTNNVKFIVEPSPKLHHNVSRIKSDDICSSSIGGLLQSVDKPEKPERKFNSRELIEKQKKWTSHFTKTKSNRNHSDQNRCDIIRTGPGTILIPGSCIQLKENTDSVSIDNSLSESYKVVPTDAEMKPPALINSLTSVISKPPSPPARQKIIPPEIKPRNCNKVSSPVKSPPLPPLPSVKPKNASPVKVLSDCVRSPTKTDKTSFAHLNITSTSPLKHSIEEDTNKIVPSEKDPMTPIENCRDVGRNHSSTSVICSSFSSKVSSSGLCSPVQTENEKQENESTEKSEVQSFSKDLYDHQYDNGYSNKSDCQDQQLDATNSISPLKHLPAPVTNTSSNIIQTPEICSRSSNIKSSLASNNKAATCENNKTVYTDVISEEHTLNYVDVGFRHNPDGSESNDAFGESQFHNVSSASELQKKFKANGFAQETSTVYATIKPEIPPLNELYYGSIIDKGKVPLSSSTKINETNNSASISSSSTTENLHLVNDVSSTDDCETFNLLSSKENNQSILPSTNDIKTIDSFQADVLKEITSNFPQINEFDIEKQGLLSTESTDICTTEHIENVKKFDLDNLSTTPTHKSIRTSPRITKPAAENIIRDDTLPDAMTADEAERLLSSRILESKIRQQPLLSDEQAKEVEQILSVVPSVGAEVATVVIPSTVSTSINDDTTDLLSSALDVEKYDKELYNIDNGKDIDTVKENELDDINGLGTTQMNLKNALSYDKIDDEDEEPEWLRDVLDAPNRSFENLQIVQTNKMSDDVREKGENDENIKEEIISEINKLKKFEKRDQIMNDIKSVQSNEKSVASPQDFFNQTTIQDSLHESIASIDSTQSDITLNQTTTIDDSIISSKHNSTYSLIEGEKDSINFNNSYTTADLEDSQYYIPEYPPVRSKEVYVESGVHYFEDGNFWMEVPGLLDFDNDDLLYPSICVKRNTKVRFSSGPIQVFSTFSVTDYDRRNEDVDPVAASAEYELEKRVEKMHVFPVELMKGPEGLGLSIIGMGVGADAGLEKLGIFVKTITDNGAAARDGRIQVNDQIIEVDGKSLVGVTQAYAASVLRNTSGLVKFQIGREKDPENSEVAQLIRLSLQADREKEERLKRQQDEYLRRTLDYSEESTQPISANSSVCDGPTSPVQIDNPITMEVEATHSQEVESLKRLLQENEVNCILKDDFIEKLKMKLVKLETTGNENELLNERLRQCERELTNIKKEALNLQNMLQQSQTQYMTLDKKYNKTKKLVREYQQREIDMCHREEFYQQLLQEKDTEYNALVKKLKDRVINLEHELQETQKKAGFPISLPYDSTTLKLTPQMIRKAPPKPLFQKLDTELSDTEISDLSPDGEGVKTATVERKIPIKDELDAAVPPHELLDNSVTKTKKDLASRSGLANRQLPTSSISLNFPNKEHHNEAIGEDLNKVQNNVTSEYESLESEEPLSHESIQQQQTVNNLSGNSNQLNHTTGTTTAILLNCISPSSASNSVAVSVSSRELQINQLYAQVQKDHKNLSTHSTIPNIFKTAIGSPVEISGNVNDFYRGNMITFGTGNRELNNSYDSILGSNDKLSETEQSENWMYPSRKRVTSTAISSSGKIQTISLSDHLSQSLPERERLGDGSSRHSSDDYTEVNKNQSTAAINCKTLINEIRQAVNEAQPKVKKVIPQSLSPPGTVPWQQQQQQTTGPPSPTSMSSGCSSPGYSPSRVLNLSGSSNSFSDRKASAGYNYKGGPVHEWTKDQVGHWLLGIELERYIPVFKDHNVEGGALLTLDSKDFKTLGISGEDKQRLKRRLKDLKSSIEKERRDQERERREREKAIKKAEKKAAKKK
ncbi:uncharacterized protein LOC119672925 isoform X2 [Teleopsis dalmanni]|uniref:uncharacterized protein LOC119672925 isoform X2 n=1 Tax=Teleopsis dalmanni TaxID=139649 RepID=UPI0018CDCCC1|nr:uncharacterized protein LOC119672925 isoform X2 [Teleopsis dalmanni]